MLVFGSQRSTLSLPGGCQLLVNPPLVAIPGLTLTAGPAGRGALVLPLQVPPWSPAINIASQAFVLDPSVSQGFAASNGLEIIVR